MNQELFIEKQNAIMKKHNILYSINFDACILAFRKSKTQKMSQELIKDLENFQEWIEEERSKYDNPHLYS